MFMGESWMGDKLRVLLWQQEDSRATVRYVIRRSRNGQEDVIFHASMVFGKASALSSHL